MGMGPRTAWAQHMSQKTYNVMMVLQIYVLIFGVLTKGLAETTLASTPLPLVGEGGHAMTVPYFLCKTGWQTQHTFPFHLILFITNMSSHL